MSYGGFAVGAADADNLQRGRGSAVKAGGNFANLQSRQRQQRRLVWRARRSKKLARPEIVCIDDDRSRAPLNRLGNKIESVALRAANRKKQLSRPRAAAVQGETGN